MHYIITYIVIKAFNDNSFDEINHIQPCSNGDFKGTDPFRGIVCINPSKLLLRMPSLKNSILLSIIMAVIKSTCVAATIVVDRFDLCLIAFNRA